MKKLILVKFALILSISFIFAQEGVKGWEILEDPEFSMYVLKDENILDSYSRYDYSTLLVPRSDFLGYIGQEYRRIKIFYTSVIKDSQSSVIYHIKGISLVGENKCNFEGTVKLIRISEVKFKHFGVDQKFMDQGLKAQGGLIGEYEFRENPDQDHSGVFEGTMYLYWYVDRFDIIHYDNIEWFSDRYRNNQFSGTWTSYQTKARKVCNWGEFRVPFSGDLDIGAGQFHPNPKYRELGWEDLMYE